MAALFRAASPEASHPRPEFVATLQASLEQALQQPAPHFPFLSRKPAHSFRKKRLAVSRRALFAGGATAAASLVAGAGLEATVANLAGSRAPTNPWSTPLLSADEGEWIVVAKLADLGEDAIRFATDSLVGYVIHSDGDQGEKPGVIAISASCSHMGCLVHWQRSDRKYHCPCHGGLFSEYGKPDKAASIPYLVALPRLETRITTRGNERFIEVKVPANPWTNGS
jgi:Rieske Fe-S protein